MASSEKCQYCGADLETKQVQKEGENRGRWFLSCPNYKNGPKCKTVFKWIQRRPDSDTEDKQKSKRYRRSPSPAEEDEKAIIPYLDRIYQAQQKTLALMRQLTKQYLAAAAASVPSRVEDFEDPRIRNLEDQDPRTPEGPRNTVVSPDH